MKNTIKKVAFASKVSRPGTVPVQYNERNKNLAIRGLRLEPNLGNFLVHGPRKKGGSSARKRNTKRQFMNEGA